MATHTMAADREGAQMTNRESGVVAVSRRIAAPAHEIFRFLADPHRHVDLDGSGMLRGAASEGPIRGVGDVFVTRMYYERLGPYEMNNHVVEYEQDRKIGWEPRPGRGHPDAGTGGSWGHRWSFALAPDGPPATIVTHEYDCSRVPESIRAGMDGGRVWLESMARTLRRLDQLCTVKPDERV